MDTSFLVIDSKVLPEVYNKVIKAKSLIRTGQAKTIQDAVKLVGISRSAFYKYKDAVFPFYEINKTKVITIGLLLNHEKGILSKVLDNIANANGNILTINQNIPNHGIANVTISFQTEELDQSGDEIVQNLSSIRGVKKIHIIGRE